MPFGFSSLLASENDRVATVEEDGAKSFVLDRWRRPLLPTALALWMVANRIMVLFYVSSLDC